MDLLLKGQSLDEARNQTAGMASHTLTARQVCDVELLLNGGFAPLTGFMARADYEAVVSGMRLASGALWPMPITLDLSAAEAAQLKPGQELALKNSDGTALAILKVEDVYQPDRAGEAQRVFGTQDMAHPGVSYLLDKAGTHYVGGTLKGLALPAHEDYPELRRTPGELKAEISKRGWKKVVAFQTRNPMHRAHVELTVRAAKEVGGGLLVHPVVGMTKPGDIDHLTRVRCYQKIMGHYPQGSAMLGLLPLAMRMGGPREALWHALIRKNYGCTHFIVGRDHAGPGKDSAGKPFYGPYDAQEIVRKHEAEAGIAMVPFKNMVYVKEKDAYMPDDEVPPGATVLSISGTEQRKLLAEGKEIPSWFTYPDVVEELKKNPNLV